MKIDIAQGEATGGVKQQFVPGITNSKPHHETVVRFKRLADGYLVAAARTNKLRAAVKRIAQTDVIDVRFGPENPVAPLKIVTGKAAGQHAASVQVFGAKRLGEIPVV